MVHKVSSDYSTKTKHEYRLTIALASDGEAVFLCPKIARSTHRSTPDPVKQENQPRKS